MKYQSINTFSIIALAAWCNSAHARAVIDPEIAERDLGGDLAAGVLMQACQSYGGIVLWQPDITAGTTDQKAAGFTAKGIIKLEDVTVVKDAPITDQYGTALAAIAAWSRLNPEEVQAKFKIDQHDTTPWCILPDGKQITVKGPEFKDWGYTETHGTDFAPSSELFTNARQVTTVKDRPTRWSWYIWHALFGL